MTASDELLTLAELAIGLAGFAGVVAAFAYRGELAAIDRMRSARAMGSQSDRSSGNISRRTTAYRASDALPSALRTGARRPPVTAEVKKIQAPRHTTTDAQMTKRT